MKLQGKVHLFGNNINTDDIIAGKYKHKTIDVDELSNHIMENIRPNFRQLIKKGDFIVAGENFGCGSSREQAPQIINHLGISAVVAKSFARIFFRNSINIGLLLIECNTDSIDENEELIFNAKTNQLFLSKSNIFINTPTLPIEVLEIVNAGGLLNYASKGGFNE